MRLLLRMTRSHWVLRSYNILVHCSIVIINVFIHVKTLLHVIKLAG
jgi:hypothetical protein